MSVDGYEERQAHQDDLAAQRWDSLMLDEQFAEEAGERDRVAGAPRSEREELRLAREFFNVARLQLKQAYYIAMDPTVEAQSAIGPLRSAHVDMLLAKADLLRAMLRAQQALRTGR
jgi:hypothetical protein